jgi:hypothetical protein
MKLLLKADAHDGKNLHERGYTDTWPDDVEPPKSAKKLTEKEAELEAKKAGVVPKEPETLAEMTTKTKAELQKELDFDDKKK